MSIPTCPTRCANCGEIKGAGEPYETEHYCARCGRYTKHEPDDRVPLACSGCGKELQLVQAWFDSVNGRIECQQCAGVELNA